ncbi:MAG: GGDEF domain-containing phosphodiesterase [Lachnospiraceae bacterium]|nr:GGDEF domain-containing phosphodiesterase [Lachnospiraceae bacterium]
MDFIGRLTEKAASLEQLKRALKPVADRYRIYSIDLERNSKDGGSENVSLFLYKKGKPRELGMLIFPFEADPIYPMVLCFIPDDRNFDDNEKAELEIYAAFCYFYLQGVQAAEMAGKVQTHQILTGLLNAQGYIKRIAELVNEGIPLTFYDAYYFNISGFGNFNRRLGYEGANRLLIVYAQAIKKNLKEDELAAHQGGDNFLALIRRDRREEFLKWLQDVKVHVPGCKEPLSVKARAGVWEIPSGNPDPGDLIGHPAIALSQAKHVLHQDHAFVSDSMVDRVTHIKNVMEAYETALEQEEFLVYYQPKVDSRNNTLVGAEGLVRWKRDGRTISPGSFIPPLEENGQILQLDCYVLRRACADIRRWLDEGKAPVTISVNFSRKDLEDKKLARRIKQIIDEAGIDKKWIEVEVTETVDTTEHGELAAFIRELYDYGIMTAIDDFGSGYSSLATLREYQVHTLKIDRSFVNNNDFSWKDEIILRDIVHMAQELGIETLTEGVERDDQLMFVKSVGCHVIQGYYYDKPLPCEEFEERLVKRVYAPRG